MEVHQIRTPRDLEALSGVSYKTIQRLLKPYDKHSPNLDSLDGIAFFFKIDTHKLLVRRKMPMVSGHETRTTETPARQEVIPARKTRRN